MFLSPCDGLSGDCIEGAMRSRRGNGRGTARIEGFVEDESDTDGAGNGAGEESVPEGGSASLELPGVICWRDGCFGKSGTGGSAFMSMTAGLMALGVSFVEVVKSLMSGCDMISGATPATGAAGAIEWLVTLGGWNHSGGAALGAAANCPFSSLERKSIN